MNDKTNEEHRQRVISECHNDIDIVLAEDGFRYFWVNGRGAMSAAELRIIADELDYRNKAWKEQVERELNQSTRRIDSAGRDVTDFPGLWGEDDTFVGQAMESDSTEKERPTMVNDSDDDDGHEPRCMSCGGEGIVDSVCEVSGRWGWDDDDPGTCPNCNGSGLRKDQTYF